MTWADISHIRQETRWPGQTSALLNRRQNDLGRLLRYETGGKVTWADFISLRQEARSSPGQTSALWDRRQDDWMDRLQLYQTGGKMTGWTVQLQQTGLKWDDLARLQLQHVDWCVNNRMSTGHLEWRPHYLPSYPHGEVLNTTDAEIRKLGPLCWESRFIKGSLC